MRKECERRCPNEVGIVDRVNDLGARAWAVAPELFFYANLKIHITIHITF